MYYRRRWYYIYSSSYIILVGSASAPPMATWTSINIAMPTNSFAIIDWCCWVQVLGHPGCKVCLNSANGVLLTTWVGIYKLSLLYTAWWNAYFHEQHGRHSLCCDCSHDTTVNLWAQVGLDVHCTCPKQTSGTGIQLCSFHNDGKYFATFLYTDPIPMMYNMVLYMYCVLQDR